MAMSLKVYLQIQTKHVYCKLILLKLIVSNLGSQMVFEDKVDHNCLLKGISSISSW